MQQIPVQVHTFADLKQFDGQLVVAHGIYRAVARPVKGALRSEPKDRAVLQLDDGTDVYLEPLDSQRSPRAAAELRRFDARRVRVEGTAHQQMPARGQSLIAPCLAGVTLIEEENQ